MRLLVTGTRRGRPDVELWLGRWMQRHDVPSLLVVGDARGVDAQAYAWGRLVGAAIKREAVDRTRPSPERYRERNARMVEQCEPGDHCLALPDADSRGTWHCVRLARRAQLTVFVLPERL